MKLHRHKTILTTLLLVAICCAATARVVYFYQANHSSTIRLHRWHDTDMAYFESWAQLIAGGDLLSKKLQPPLHEWQIRLAHNYLTLTDARGKTQEQNDREAANAVWSKWLKPAGFYQDPLYSYALAAVYRFISTDHRVFIALQQFLGIGTLCLLYLTTRHAFGRTLATITTVLAVAYPMALFYEIFLLREAAILFFSLLLVLAVQSLRRKPNFLRYALFGLAAGLAILLKSSLALLVLFLILGHLLTARNALRSTRKLQASGLMLAVMLLSVAPLMVRNLACDLPLFSLPGEGSIVFALHNVNGYLPMGGDDFSDSLLHSVAKIATRTDFKLLPTIIETIKTHESVSTYLGFVLKKFLYVWGWFEIPSNENFYFETMQVPVLTLLPIGFIFIMALGLTGIVLSARRRHRCWPFYALIITNVFFLTLFLNLSRLRLPLAMSLIPFTAFTIVKGWQFAKRRCYRRLTWMTVAIALLASLSYNWPARHYTTIRTFDYIIYFQSYYWPRIQELESSGQQQAAAAMCHRTLQTASEQRINLLLADSEPVTPDNYDMLLHFYEAHLRCADVYASSGMVQEARTVLATARGMEAALDRQTLYLDQQQ